MKQPALGIHPRTDLEFVAMVYTVLVDVTDPADRDPCAIRRVRSRSGLVADCLANDGWSGRSRATLQGGDAPGPEGVPDLVDWDRSWPVSMDVPRRSLTDDRRCYCSHLLGRKDGRHRVGRPAGTRHHMSPVASRSRPNP